MAIEPGRVKALFQAAIELNDTSERQAFLDREVGEDSELARNLTPCWPPTISRTACLTNRSRQTRLPGTTAAASPPPAGPSPAEARTIPRDADSALVDTVIAGRYKLRQEIGEGGMGTVYFAEQTQPVRRQVALKLIKAGMDSKTVLARFETERQALALMDHPNIARVLDAGTTEHGRPFFVMELVKGIPLTNYCDQHRLELAERLALFRQICSAVQHAHQKGIIHRDLKPTNILVESHDGQPVPKVIDFGLAKATSGMRLSEHSLFTAFGTVAGTPLYMAPEQAAFNALDVDTRADIYALGVILYELLTGSTPIQRDTLKRAALDEMLRLIREVEPPTPSSRISTSEALPSIAASRHVQPMQLSRLVRGDLDWIVMKALAKERNRRYDSAIGLANDIERFANHEPVERGAAHGSLPDAKVHPEKPGAGGSSGAGSLGVARRRGGDHRRSTGGAPARREGSTTGAARRGRSRGEGTGAAGRSPGAPEGRKAARSGDEDERDPRLDLPRPGPEERRQGRQAAVGRAGRAARPGDGGDRGGGHRRTAGRGADADETGRFAAWLGVSAKGARALREGQGHIHRQARSRPPRHAQSMNNLAISYADAGQNEQALKLREETLALLKAKLGPDHPDTLRSMNNLASSYVAAGQYERALKLREETLALQKAKLGPDHPDTLRSMNNLAIELCRRRTERARRSSCTKRRWL